MKNEKHQQAYNLYFQTNLSQVQIAKLLDVDRKTIHNWLSEGNWRQQKKTAMHMPSKIAEQFYYMLANLNHEILSRAHQPYPLTHEAEQMRKVSVCIRHVKNRQTTNEAMESYMHLAEAISHKDPELAARLTPYIREYIQGRADVKFTDLVAEGYHVDPAMDRMYDYEVRPADDDDTSAAAPATPPETTGPDAPADSTITPPGNTSSGRPLPAQPLATRSADTAPAGAEATTLPTPPLTSRRLDGPDDDLDELLPYSDAPTPDKPIPIAA